MSRILHVVSEKLTPANTIRIYRKIKLTFGYFPENPFSRLTILLFFS